MEDGSDQQIRDGEQGICASGVEDICEERCLIYRQN